MLVVAAPRSSPLDPTSDLSRPLPWQMSRARENSRVWNDNTLRPVGSTFDFANTIADFPDVDRVSQTRVLYIYKAHAPPQSHKLRPLGHPGTTRDSGPPDPTEA